MINKSTPNQGSSGRRRPRWIFEALVPVPKVVVDVLVVVHGFLIVFVLICTENATPTKPFRQKTDTLTISMKARIAIYYILTI